MGWKPVYASLGEMREWLRINNPADTTHDSLLRRKLGAASRALDTTCGRQFGKVASAVAREYKVRWSRTWQAYVAEIDDLMDTTDLAFTLDGVELTADQYKLRPRNAVADGEPYTYVLISATPTGDGELEGLALWGWNAPYPDGVVESTMLQASRLNVRLESPYGIAGGSDSGSELRLLERLDPDIAPLVAGYVRTGWVAK